MNNPRFKVDAFDSSTTPRLNAKKSNAIFEKPSNPLKVSNGKADVLFLDECTKSRKIEDLFFCNYLPDFIKYTDVHTCISDLLNNPNNLVSDLQQINFIFKNGERIQKIVSNVLGEKLTQKYLSVIYESRLNSEESITQKGKVRVFSLYSVIHKDNKNKNILIVFLFDPFHLVCPVPNKKMNSIKAMKCEYSNSNDYKKNFFDFFDFQKVKFIKKQDMI